MWSENPSQWTILEPLCYSSFVFATLVHGVIGYKFCWLLPQSRSTRWTWISWDTNWARITLQSRERTLASILEISTILVLRHKKESSGRSSWCLRDPSWLWSYLHWLELIQEHPDQRYVSLFFKSMFSMLSYCFLIHVYPLW